MNVQQSIAVSAIVTFQVFGFCFFNVVAFESTISNCNNQRVLAQQTEDFYCPICYEYMEPSQIRFTRSCYHLFCAPYVYSTHPNTTNIN